MNIVNTTPFPFAPLLGKVVYPQDTLTVIIKGTFRLIPGQPAQAMDNGAHQPPNGDLHYDDDPHTSVRYASDFVHFKPKADLLLAGHCHVPGGRPIPACNVRFHVGAHQKALMVFGDRHWRRTKIGTRTMSDPTPFARMEVRYENSFGGPDYRNNPVGKGIHSQKDTNGRTHHKLANIKLLEGDSLKTMAQGIPAGFGPIGKTWGHRMTLVGHYGEKWKRERWPWLPEDFNWGYCNDAPPDQQVKGYLKGDESLYFENLHPDLPEYHSALPGLRVRCFLSEQHQGENRFREINTHLDTLWVDMDDETLILVWRGLATVANPECDQVQDLLIVQEPVKEKPGTLEDHYHILEQRRAQADADGTPTEETPEAEEIDIQAAETPDMDGTEDTTLQAGLEKAMTQVREALGRSDLDAGLMRGLKGETDPEVFLEKLGVALGIDDAAVAKVKAHARKKQKEDLDKYWPQIKKSLEQGGVDADLIDETYTSLAEEQDAEASSETKAIPGPSGGDFRGESLEGADFREAQLDGADFSNARLAGADFSEASLINASFENADLTGATLAHADLSNARLTGAVLREADLSGAVLVEANLAHADLAGCVMTWVQLDHADLTQATLTKAHLEQADISGGDLTRADLREVVLDFAILDGAILTQADLHQARANQVSFQGCMLLETNFTDADVEECDFSQCRCDHADFQAARLNRSTFEGATGHHVNFREAGLEKIRAGEDARLPGSIFRRACGAKGNWAGADLQGADFILAEMPFCDFSGANLSGSDCRTADLKGAVFDKAELDNVLFNRTNLFQSRMEQTRLAGTNFKGANVYGAEFLNAAIDKKTNFSQANLKGTKLADLKT